MVGRWLSWLNCCIIVFVSLLIVGMGFIWLKRPDEVICSNPIAKHCGLPKGAFAFTSEAYAGINEPLLSLQSSPPSLQLPDLRSHLIYYGKNGRPDAHSAKTFLHFSLNGSKTVVSVVPGEKLYLLYDKASLPSHYVLSPKNEQTSLWIEANPQDNEMAVRVFMQNDKGEVITEPDQHAHFKLPEKEFIRYAGTTWEIGSWRVDGTLLARQRARWFGPDRFLEKHGGEDYEHIKGKQRVEFGEGDDLYSVFIGIGDCLIWDGSHWKVIKPGEDSLKHPLLVVKKVEERLMTFELWDVEGKGKVLLNLLKSAEPWGANHTQSLQHMFKFVGARTRTQCVFEINRERVLMSPSDWLLLTSKGWKKLETEEDIDNYVKRKTPGMLFVFGGLTRKDEKQVLVGILYSPSRNDYQEIELAIQQGGTTKNSSKDSGADEKPASATAKLDSEAVHPVIPTSIPPTNALVPVPTFPMKDQPSTR